MRSVPGLSGSTVAIVVFVLFGGALAYRYWPSDERAIRRHLHNLAEAMSTPAGSENEAVQLTRFAAMREYFAEDVRVQVSEGTLVSREPVLSAIAQAARPGRLAVNLVDLRIARPLGGSDARVSVVARVTTPGGRGTNGPDALRRADIDMTKANGDWVITAVRELER